MTLRHTTVGEAREMENFLPERCPHEPKGWLPHPSTEAVA